MDLYPDYETTFVQSWQPERPCSHQEAFSRCKAFVLRQAGRRLQKEIDNWAPEFRAMLNDGIKKKFLELLPKLQSDLIDDLQQ